MAVLSFPSSALVPAAPAASGRVCSLQRSGSLGQLGIEAQELTTAIGLLAEQLEADDDTRAQALGELEASLLGDRAPSRPGRLPAAAAGQAPHRAVPLRCLPRGCPGGLPHTMRSLPRALLDSLTQGFRRRFQVPDSAVTIADRITLQCHHDWIETFLVSHREVCSADQHQGQ